MARNNEIPEVNAGSMADIAFLLLIFFLVAATIQTDVGLDRKLPPQELSPPMPVNERNIFRVSLNKNDELWVENEPMQIEDLKSAAITFLDNGGDKGHCDYCKGNRSSDSSDSPKKAIVSFASDREASYGAYIRVQNELTAAYNELMNRESQLLFNKDFVDMEETYYDQKTMADEKSKLKENIYQVRNMYPMNLTEAKTNMSL